jgi:UbiD family decarboxylase
MLSGKAPCQDEIITGEDIDIRRWPIPTYSPKDGGPYITRASWCRRIPRPACPTSAITAS